MQMPFRETHHISGACVRLAEESKVLLSALTLPQLQQICPLFGDDTLTEVFDFEKSVERRDVYGGPSRRRVLEQIQVVRASLG
jgi:argininosuccinate lyase